MISVGQCFLRVPECDVTLAAAAAAVGREDGDARRPGLHLVSLFLYEVALLGQQVGLQGVVDDLRDLVDHHHGAFAAGHHVADGGAGGSAVDAVGAQGQLGVVGDAARGGAHQVRHVVIAHGRGGAQRV